MRARIGHRRIRVENLNDELRLVSELRKFGQPFKIVSKTDYEVSAKQCNILKNKKIPYRLV